jgi:hypothetical protein
MGIFKLNRQNREKQIGVKLSEYDTNMFQTLCEQLQYQTISDGIRGLLREGYLKFKDATTEEMAQLLQDLPSVPKKRGRSIQVNARFNPTEIKMSEELQNKMGCSSLSKMIRNLNSLYHTSLTHEKDAATQKERTDAK